MQRTVTSIGAERPGGGHQRLLCRVLRVARTAEDSEANAEHGRRLPLDHDLEGVTIAVENGIDEGAVVHALIVPCQVVHPRSSASRSVAVARTRVVIVTVARTRVVIV